MSYFGVAPLTRVHWFNQLGAADAARFVCALESVRQLDWVGITRTPGRRLVLKFGRKSDIEVEFGEPGQDVATAMRQLNRDLSRAIYQRLETGAAFRACVLLEAARAMFDDNLPLTKGLLRRVIDATIGYAELAIRMEGHPKSLVRMLGPNGNPSAVHLLGILTCLARVHHVRFTVNLAERSSW